MLRTLQYSLPFPLQQWLRERTSGLRSYLRCLSCYVRICRVILFFRRLLYCEMGSVLSESEMQYVYVRSDTYRPIFMAILRGV